MPRARRGYSAGCGHPDGDGARHGAGPHSPQVLPGGDSGRHLRSQGLCRAVRRAAPLLRLILTMAMLTMAMLTMAMLTVAMLAMVIRTMALLTRRAALHADGRRDAGEHAVVPRAAVRALPLCALPSAWEANLPTYPYVPSFLLRCVLCVGGSWIVPQDVLKARDFARITQIAADAVAAALASE